MNYIISLMYNVLIKEILEQNKNKGIQISELAKITTMFPDWLSEQKC